MDSEDLNWGLIWGCLDFDDSVIGVEMAEAGGQREKLGFVVLRVEGRKRNEEGGGEGD